ncbi:DUF7014 domain-containing protein [Halodesulfovibrio aestuarii]|uniref:DUF7014 domain-containing protein n=1 Tax=Halodesulfovibrio aestuarii TaxID=126333 RepID=A0ABV4JUG3_9BACT
MSSEKYIPFFRRQQAARGELPTTFKYDLPEKVRKQIWMLWNQSGLAPLSHNIVQFLYLELGTTPLPNCPQVTNYFTGITPEDELYGYLSNVKNIDYALTVIELMSMHAAQQGYTFFIDNVNERLQIEAIGYKIDVVETSALLRSLEDEQFSAYVTEPCLSILSKFPTARQHYLEAYEELKKKKYDDAMTDLAQAMESLLKTRFTQEQIAFSKRDTLGKLLDTAQKHAVCGDFSFHRFKELILNVGQGRNNNSHGHAEGNKPEIDAVYTRFMINQAAANLLFLAEVELCHK